MAIPADPVPIEMLLAHREWVRRVARALVADENVADDLEQDLWVGALTRPPHVTGSARGWLAAALRHSFLNRRRAEVRRQRREESVSRPEREPSTEEVVAVAEAHRNVVVEVMRLAEPYRGTILLRYFQGLAPAAIAARENVPVETVHTRLRRARETLRERLAAPEDRHGWRFALAPLFGNGAPPDSSAPYVAGGLIVKTSSKISLAGLFAVLLAGVALLGLRGTRGPETVAPPASATGAAAPESASPPRLAAAPRRSPEAHADAAMGPDERSPGAGPSVAIGPIPRETPDSSRVPAPAGEIVGRVLNLADRSPVEGAHVRSMGGGGFPAGAVLPRVEPITTGADGVFRFVGFQPGGTYYFRASKTGRSEVTFHARVTAGAGVGGIDVLLGPGGAVEGRVTDARGGAAVGVTVELEVPGDAIAGVMKPTRTSTKTGVDGKYQFSELTPEYYTVTVKRAEGREQTGRVGDRWGSRLPGEFQSEIEMRRFKARAAFVLLLLMAAGALIVSRHRSGADGDRGAAETMAPLQPTPPKFVQPPILLGSEQGSRDPAGSQLRLQVASPDGTALPVFAWLEFQHGGRHILGSASTPTSNPESSEHVAHGSYRVNLLDPVSGESHAEPVVHANSDPHSIVFRRSARVLHVRVADEHGADWMNRWRLSWRATPSASNDPLLRTYESSSALLAPVAVGQASLSARGDSLRPDVREFGPNQCSIELPVPASTIVQLTVEADGRMPWWLSVPSGGDPIEVVATLAPMAAQVFRVSHGGAPVGAGYRVTALVARVTRPEWAATTDDKSEIRLVGYPENGMPIFVLREPQGVIPLSLIDLSTSTEGLASFFNTLSIGHPAALDFPAHAKTEDYTVDAPARVLDEGAEVTAWYRAGSRETGRQSIIVGLPLGLVTATSPIVPVPGLVRDTVFEIRLSAPFAAVRLELDAPRRRLRATSRVVQGTVVTSEGVALPGAAVGWTPASEGARHLMMRLTQTTTDGQGQFSFLASPEAGEVEATLLGFRVNRRTVAVTDDSQIQLVLDRASTALVRVQGNSLGVPSIAIVYPPRGERIDLALSGDEVRIPIDDPGGKASVQVRFSDGLAVGPIVEELKAGEEIVVVRPAHSRQSFHLTDNPGDPVPVLRVTWMDAASRVSNEFTTRLRPGRNEILLPLAGHIRAEIRPEGYLAGVPRVGRNAQWSWNGAAEAFPDGVDLAQGQRVLEFLPYEEDVSLRVAVGSGFELGLVVPAGQSRSVRVPPAGTIVVTPSGGIGARFPDETTSIDLRRYLVRAVPTLDPALVSRGARPETARLRRSTGASVGEEFGRTSSGAIIGFQGASEVALIEIDGESEASPVTLTVTDRGVTVTPRSD